MSVWVTYIDALFEILIPASDKYGWLMTNLFSFFFYVRLPVWLDVFSSFWRHHLPHHGVGPDGNEPRPGDQVQCSSNGDGHCSHHQPGGYSDPWWNLRRYGIVADWTRYRNTVHKVIYSYSCMMDLKNPMQCKIQKTKQTNKLCYI